MRRSMMVALGVILALAISMTMVGAEDTEGPSYALVYFPDETYHVGSQITVHVVYVSGVELIDVIGPYVEFGKTERSVALDRTATGTYEVTVEILEEDVENDLIHIWAYHENSDVEQDVSLVEVVSVEDPEARYKYLDLVLLDASDAQARPGQSIEFQVRSYNETGMADPYPDTLEVVAVDRLTDDEHPLEVSQVEEGVYQGAFTIPADLNTSRLYVLRADAVIPVWDGDNKHESWGAYVYVDLLDVYMHVVETDRPSTSLRFYVRDRDGAPVEGADVLLSCGYADTTGWYGYLSESAVTDSAGEAFLTFDHDDLGRNESMIRILGEVRTTDTVHDINEWVSVTEHIGHWANREYDEGIQWDADNWLPGWGEQVTTNVTLFYDGVPVTNTPAFYCVRYTSDDYTVGGGTTDDNGTFLMTYDTPADPRPDRYIILDLMVLIDGEWIWDFLPIFVGMNSPYDHRFSRSTGPAYVHISDTEITDGFDVTVGSPDADGVMESAWVFWGIGNPYESGTYFTSDWRTVGFTVNTFNPVECRWDGGKYRATVGVPDFLPGGLEIWTIGVIEFNDRPGVPSHAGLGETITLARNNPPSVTLDGPGEIHNVTGAIWINGTASDDGSLLEVQISIDGGEWRPVDGTSVWNHLLDTDAMTEGNHTIRVRAYDGEQYSTPEDLSITVDKKSDVGSNGGDGDGLGSWVYLLFIIVIVLIVLTVVFVLRTR